MIDSLKIIIFTIIFLYENQNGFRTDLLWSRYSSTQGTSMENQMSTEIETLRVVYNLWSRGIHCDTSDKCCLEEIINYVLFECPLALQTWVISVGGLS